MGSAESKSGTSSSFRKPLPSRSYWDSSSVGTSVAYAGPAPGGASTCMWPDAVSMRMYSVI